jgi:hypothetical protein
MPQPANRHLGVTEGIVNRGFGAMKNGKVSLFGLWFKWRGSQSPMPTV